jgi:tetratricopeptide (TPR) repeat protein
VATPPAPPADADAAVAEAMERFADANTLFERGDHRGALAELQRVYALLEGRENQYIVLFNLGRVYEELHRYDLAVDRYAAYLRLSPADAENRPYADASLRALDRLLGVVSIRVDVPHAEVWIGQWQVGEAPGEVRVPAGVHQLELRRPGHETARRQIEVSARSRLELALSLPLLAESYAGLEPTAFVAVSIATGVAALAGGVLGGLALSSSADVEACGRQPGCTLDVAVRWQEVADLALGADLAFGTAGAFAVGAVVLLLLTNWGEPEVAAERGDAGLAGSRFVGRVAPVLTPSGGGLVTELRF